MSYGTSDTTVISSTKIEARNLNAIDASATSRDGSSLANLQANTAENRQLYNNYFSYSIEIMRECSCLLQHGQVDMGLWEESCR